MGMLPFRHENSDDNCILVSYRPLFENHVREQRPAYFSARSGLVAAGPTGLMIKKIKLIF
jgi:hypothetical protein